MNLAYFAILTVGFAALTAFIAVRVATFMRRGSARAYWAVYDRDSNPTLFWMVIFCATMAGTIGFALSLFGAWISLNLIGIVS